MRRLLISTAGIAMALGLAACGGHPSAVQSQGGQAASSAGEATSQASYGGRDATTTQVNGKPMWAANRKHTAGENAQYQFTKNGQDFGAQSESDYVTKVHAFIDSPPTDAQTIDRANGDRLIYAAKTNTFAVVSRDGAPRTMFKPRDGAAYWTVQKQREADRNKSAGDGGSNQS
jgi:pyocin large subunit-like protein